MNLTLGVQLLTNEHTIDAGNRFVNHVVANIFAVTEIYAAWLEIKPKQKLGKCF